MSRGLENQIKRANNMLKYYNEKLKNDQSKRKDMGFNNTKKLIKIICYLILVIINISLIVQSVAIGNILLSIIPVLLSSVILDQLLINAKKFKNDSSKYYSLNKTIIQDKEYIKTYEEELNKALSKLKELENEQKKNNNYTLNNSEDLSKPLVRKRVLK